MIPLQYTFRSLAVRKATTLSTTGGIALVIFVFATALMLSAGIRKTLSSSGKAANAIVLRRGATSEASSVFPQQLVGMVLTQPGIKMDERGSPLGIGEIVVIGGLPKVGGKPKDIVNVIIRGVPANVLAFRPEVRVIEGRPAQVGTEEVTIGKAIRGRLAGVDLNGTFELAKGHTVKVVGVFDSGGSSFDSEIWADRDVLTAAYGRQGLMSSVRLQLQSAAAFDTLKAAIGADKRLGLTAIREVDFYEQQSDMLSTLVIMLGTLVSLFVGIGAMLGAAVTMHGAVAQRSREIGTLRALGFARSSVLMSFLFESVVIATIGGVIGTLASLSMRYVQFSLSNPSTYAETIFSFDPTPRVIGTALMVAVIMGVLGGFLPALRAARLSTIDALRG
jgi:putative ABC transport system permease protein